MRRFNRRFSIALVVPLRYLLASRVATTVHSESTYDIAKLIYNEQSNNIEQLFTLRNLQAILK